MMRALILNFNPPARIPRDEWRMGTSPHRGENKRTHRLYLWGSRNPKPVISISFICACCFMFANFSAFAQEDDKLVSLNKQIMEAKSGEDLADPFEELQEFYLSRLSAKSEGAMPLPAGNENKYSDFIGLLDSLKGKNKIAEPFIAYYIALTRYQQLKYLEEKQLWDEYFSHGNSYRDEITSNAQKAIAALTLKDPLNIYALLLLWQFHQDQDDVFSQQALLDLLNSTSEYAKTASDILPIRNVADKLLAYGERAKAKELYRIYVDKIAGSNIKDEELKAIALGFYKEGNLELAQTIYDVYINRITNAPNKEDAIPVLIEIAKLFAYNDSRANDMLYAEKIFERIAASGAKAGFDEELMYLRAFNLEKAKDYPKAKDLYIELVKTYPQSGYVDEADFKTGIILTYILQDPKSGRDYFEKLAQKEQDTNPRVISSLYQLGLLAQWENNSASARQYYNKLLELAGENFLEDLTLTKERLEEIEEERPIEYNLKTFLDLSLKEEKRASIMARLELRIHPYLAKTEEAVLASSNTYIGQNGCMQVALEYLWSGHLGTARPANKEASFTTEYVKAGTKEINLVVVSPSGILDRSIDMLDVH